MSSGLCSTVSFGPADAYVDAFLQSKPFDLICVQAIQLATVLPTHPPPSQFTSFGETLMHHWYQALLLEFLDSFIRRLRIRQCFPLKPVVVGGPGNYRIVMKEDSEAFNAEATAHINVVLQSFNTNFEQRPLGSTTGLSVDIKRLHSNIAIQALSEATSCANYAPKRGWQAGDLLASEYKRRLRTFELCLLGLLMEREHDRWILRYPKQLYASIAAYKEYYIRHLRAETIAAKGSDGHGRMKSSDDVFV